MTAKKNTTTELAVVDQFQIANRYEGIDPELLAELQDQMEDLDEESSINCRTVKIPSGGGSAFEVQSEDDDETEPMKRIEGVIVFTHRMNARWENEYGKGDGNDAPPACSSMDGKTGVLANTGEIINCDRCPYNVYGSVSGGRGKACKNMRRVYILMDGDPNLYRLTIPPTSIRDINRQLALLLNRGIPYTGMIVSFYLEKAKNAAGIAYSKVNVERKGLLPAGTAAAVQEMRRKIKEQYTGLEITASDYAPAPAPAAQGPATRGVDVHMSAEDLESLEGTDPGFSEALPY